MALLFAGSGAGWLERVWKTRPFFGRFINKYDQMVTYIGFAF